MMKIQCSLHPLPIELRLTNLASCERSKFLSKVHWRSVQATLLRTVIVPGAYRLSMVVSANLFKK